MTDNPIPIAPDIDELIRAKPWDVLEHLRPN